MTDPLLASQSAVCSRIRSARTSSSSFLRTYAKHQQPRASGSHVCIISPMHTKQPRIRTSCVAVPPLTSAYGASEGCSHVHLPSCFLDKIRPYARRLASSRKEACITRAIMVGPSLIEPGAPAACALDPRQMQLSMCWLEPWHYSWVACHAGSIKKPCIEWSMHGWPLAGLSLGRRRRALQDEAGAAVQLLVRAHRGHAERQRPGACGGRGWEQQLLQLGPADACRITNPAQLPSMPNWCTK